MSITGMDIDIDTIHLAFFNPLLLAEIKYACIIQTKSYFPLRDSVAIEKRMQHHGRRQIKRIYTMLPKLCAAKRKLLLRVKVRHAG